MSKCTYYNLLLRGGFLLLLLPAVFICNSYAQTSEGEKRVTLNENNSPLRSIFSKITQQTQLYFTGNADKLNQDERYTIRVQNETVNGTLIKLLAGKGFSWIIKDNVIAIQKGNSIPSTVKSQLNATYIDSLITISGKVIDEKGNAIIGATILIKGTNNGVTTNSNGDFTLTHVRKSAVLSITGVSFIATEIPVNGKGNIGIVKLKDYVEDLDETIIVGYGKTSKRYNVGNVATLKFDKIEAQPVSNSLAALQGRLAGVNITQTTGIPGSRFRIQIRGRNSVRGDDVANGITPNDPLYVIDGVPFSSQLIPGVGNDDVTQGGSPLNLINPQDIESIDVLKDADATAIYGSRGANGVILITTKKGEPGKTTLDVNVSQGMSGVSKMYSLLNSQQYLQMRYEAFKNDNVDWKTDPAAYAPDLLTFDTTKYTNWQKKLIGGNAGYTNVQGTVSGGNANTIFRIGTNYHRESTVFPGDKDDKRGSLQFNVSNTSNDKKFNILLSGMYTSENSQLSAYDFTKSAVTLPPITPDLIDKTGNIVWIPSIYDNPYAYLLKEFNRRSDNVIANAVISYKLPYNLELKSSFGFNKMNVNEHSTNPIKSTDPAYNPEYGSAIFAKSEVRSFLMEPQLSYDNQIGVVKINALVGSTFQERKTMSERLEATGYTSDALLGSLRSASSIITTPSGTFNGMYKFTSLFTRLNFNIKGRYILNLTGRRDGSDRFGPNKRFGNFGAIGAGWIFSSENWVQNHLGFLNFGKIRYSYGITGSDNIGDYGFVNTYSTSNRTYQGIAVLTPDNLFNPDYRWEVNKKREVGLELGLFGDLILISNSYYINTSDNQLIGYNLPNITGFASVLTNLPATVQNRGYELTIDLNLLKKQRLRWNASINTTFSKNKLTRFDNIENSSYAYDYVVGQPLDIARVLKYKEVDPATGVYVFVNKDGKPTAEPILDVFEDRYVNINRNPSFFGGINNTISYKNLTFDIFFQYVRQKGNTYLFNGFPGFFGNQPISVLDRWRLPGDHSNVQRYSSDFQLESNLNNYNTSDASYGDASYLRLKNLQISYLLPVEICSRYHLKNLRLYLQAQNLFTVTNYKGLDPETQSLTSLPTLRVLTCGLQISL